jgi:Icc-related predicted phosphoesterase
MLIHYFSDLHVEFGSEELAKRLAGNREADVIICAGDLKPSGMVGRYLHLLDDLTHCPFLFVPGNHEYYGTRKETLDRELAKQRYSNVRILNRSTTRIGDVLFIGATGWWQETSSMARLLMNDFIKIIDIHQAEDGNEWGRKDEQFFVDTLLRATEDRVVCISHHAPSWKSFFPADVWRLQNDCYANHWDDIIMEFQPAAWVHGHIHEPSNDYLLGKTRVLSNPYGYQRANRLNPDWDEKARFEI